MIQFFELFEQKYLDQLILMERIFIVTQTNMRALNSVEDGGRIPILLKGYDDKGAALIHYNAVRRLDQFGYMLDVSKPQHLAKLQEMLAGDKYRLYWAVVKSLPDLEKRIKINFKLHIQRYIAKNTNWRIKRDDGVKLYLKVIFSEMFIVIKWNSRELRVKFEEIEKC